ncbi:MAG: hypothetical protein F2793_06775 [Actinobacteria bacterium]|uniref:Unannotated protein n=1 Tax=freshwater metagenome TaxID=449393 RepID=A0A6J7EDT4_9ZZZZ|nr:hypothetical protein [Actinomycetota bacterium]
MSPVSKKRKQPPGRAPKSAARPSIIGPILSVFAERLDDDGPLQTELVLAYLLGTGWGGAQWGRTDAAEALASEIVDANPTGHPAGGLVLLALARTGPRPLREKALQALELGASSESTKWRMPDWAERIGTAELGRTAILTDVYGDQTSYYMEFSYPGTANPEQHLVVALVDYNLHLIKDMFVRVGPHVFELLEQIAKEDDAATFAPMDLQSASDDLWAHLDVTDRTLGDPSGEESAETRYLLEARLDRLPHPNANTDFRPTVAQAERGRILTAFMKTVAVKDLLSGTGSPDGPPERDSVRYIARLAIDYASDYGAGDPLRWSPIAVELFLTDWAPRKVVWDAEDVLWVPEVLDLFVAYCGKRSGLELRWIEAIREAVDEYGGDFVAIELAGNSKGPGAQVMAALLADGVDLMDGEAVQQWIARYNDSL